MHHAYKRLRKEDISAKTRWDEAIRLLRRGDHYILVMWGSSPGIRAQNLAVCGFFILPFVALYIFASLAGHFPRPNARVMQAIFLGIVFASFFFRTEIGNALGWVMDKTLFRFVSDEEEGKNED